MDGKIVLLGINRICFSFKQNIHDMENLTRKLHGVMVSMGYTPDAVPHDMAHGIGHLLSLLDPEDEKALIHYYGLFGEERMSLDELARERGLSAEDMMARIDSSVRRIAVTPEWEMMVETGS